MTTGKIAAVFGVVALFFAFMLGMGALNFFNTSTTMITAYEAKVDANKADFDNTWKTIKQVGELVHFPLDKAGTMTYH